MSELSNVQLQLLKEVADLHEVPEGAYNLRSNGKSVSRNTTANINILTKTEGSGIDIHIKDGTVNESVHIPVVLSESGLQETVYNDFYIGDNCDVLIVAGCGIDNCGTQDSEHDGIHRFYIGENSKIRYVEKHYGSGDGSGKRILNPVTEVYMSEGSTMEMEMVQIKGVDSTHRTTLAELKRNAKLIVREMTELLVLDLVDKGFVCDQIVLTVGYDIENTKSGKYTGEIKPDRYGRDVSKQAHGSENIGRYTSSTKLIVEATMRLFDRIVDKNLTVRRMYVVANHVISERDIPETHEQLDLFSDFKAVEEKRKQEDAELEREKELQKAVIALQKRFGKNSVLKGLNLKEGATTIERNGTIGGHKA